MIPKSITSEFTDDLDVSEIIKPGDDMTETYGGDYSLESLQNIVGGPIEILPTHFNHLVLVVNEEGKLQRLARNWRATLYYKKGGANEVVGTVLITNRKNLK